MRKRVQSEASGRVRTEVGQQNKPGRDWRAHDNQETKTARSQNVWVPPRVSPAHLPRRRVASPSSRQALLARSPQSLLTSGLALPGVGLRPLGLRQLSMDNSEDDPTIFSTHCLPSDPRFWATVTNSYLGTRVYHDVIHVNGVYNGAGGNTHRAILPSPINVQLKAPAGTEPLAENFALDTNTGSFLHTLEGPSFRASQCIYAHRVLPHVLAFSVSIARLTTGNKPITVLLQASFSPESPDLDLHVGPDFQGARYLHGHTLTPEQPGEPQQEVHMLWMPVPPVLTLAEDEQDRTWDFLTVVGGSQAEAQGCFAEALQLQTRGSLYTVHADAWAQLWADCGLDVAGPLALRQALRGSLYYLLSELPQPGTQGSISHGLSPGGLSNGSQEESYWGHIFWDQVHPALVTQEELHANNLGIAFTLPELKTVENMGVGWKDESAVKSSDCSS